MAASDDAVTPAYLRSHALFGGVSTPAVAAILPRLKRATFNAGAVIVAEGDVGPLMYFIRRGSVDVLKRGNNPGEELHLAVLREGDTFGEMELIDVQPRSATVRAREPITVYTLDSTDLFAVFESDHETFVIILMNIARELSRRLRRMDALLASALYRQGRPVSP